MAQGSNYLTTYYAKRIIGDAAAASSGNGLLQSGAIASNMWIFSQNNRTSEYGIKYVYDSTNDHDKVEFYGGNIVNNASTATAWVQLDTGDAVFNTVTADLEGIAHYARLLYPQSSDTVCDESSWSVIPAGGVKVWGESFSNSTLKYINDGVESTITDSGHIIMWLQPDNGTSDFAMLCMRIDGTFQSSKFIGPLNGNADSATILANGHTLKVILSSNNASNAFNGSADVHDIGVDGVLGISNGGTNNSSFVEDRIIFATTRTEDNNEVTYLNSSGIMTDGYSIQTGSEDKTITVQRYLTVAGASGRISLVSNPTSGFSYGRGLWANKTTQGGGGGYFVTLDEDAHATFYGSLSGNATSADYLSTYVATDSNTTKTILQALKNKFADIPKSVGTAIRVQIGSHAMALGYFLSGNSYNTVNTAYGGWFVAAYDIPHYVGISNGTWTDSILLHSNNYTDYTVTKTGGGASGDWNINAATATKLNSTGTTGQFWRGDNSWSNVLAGDFTVNGKIYFSGDGLYHVGTAATKQIIGIIDSGDVNGTGIRIGAGGLLVTGSGESTSAIISNLSLSAGGTETTYITSDNNIEFYPGQQSYDAAARIWMTAGVLNIGVDGNTTRENSVNVYSGAGRIQLFSAAATNGLRGLWVAAHGTGAAKTVVSIDTNNNATFNGNATSASRLVSRGNITCETGGTKPAVAGLSMSQVYNNGYPTTYGNVMTMYGSGAGQLLIGWSSSASTTAGARANAYLRSQRDTAGTLWSDWYTIIDSGNWMREIFTNKNITRSSLTVTSSTWNVTAGTDLFGLSFKDTGLKYTPSGGSATASSDTGDWRAWLTCAANSNTVNLNMRIDGTWQASKFIGPLQGNADTATKATQDGSGSTITSTYLKLSGGTLTGNLFITTDSGDHYFEVKSNATGVRLELDNSGSTNHGLWSSGYWTGSEYKASSSWMIYRNSSGTNIVNGNCTGSSGSCTGNAASATYSTRLETNTSTTSSDPGGLTWFNISAASSTTVNTNDTPSSSATWWYILRNRHTNTGNNYYTDLAIPFNTTGMYYKRIQNNAITNGWVQILSGDMDFSFLDSGTTTRSIRFVVGTNDYARIAAGATATNSGWMELATADDGTEPIYVRQYTGVFSTIKRTLTLLDASGNSSFPGTVTATKFSGPLTGNVTGNCSGSSGSCTGNAATASSVAWSGVTNKALDGVNTSDTAYVMAPGGAYYKNGAATVTGAIKITLPIFKTCTMIRFYVDIYTYDSSSATTYLISGYNYSDQNWYNFAAKSYSNNTNKANLKVRFGDDGSKSVIWIGETNTSWAHPQVRIRDVMLGHSGYNATNFNTGWTVTFVTSFGTVKQTVSNANEWSFSKVYGAVWNDYAEFRECETLTPGMCVKENDNGKLTVTNMRLISGASIISDTYGYAEGETEKAKTPIAVSGRVLAYTYLPREQYHAGMAVCSAPNGTIDIMTREEIRDYPDAIIGIVSEIPDYEIWGTGNIEVDGRIWIKVK